MEATNAALEAMRHGTLLGGLSPDVLGALLERAEIIDVAAGEVLIRQGAEGDRAFVVLAGRLEVVVETALGDVAMAEIGPQQIVGEIAVFTSLARTATVRALVDATVLGLGRATLAEVIAQHPGTAFGVIKSLAERVNALNQPLALLTLAAQALERADMDPAAMADMLASVGDDSPFARSFQKIMGEMAQKNARRHEMEFAARLQRSILPHDLSFGAASPFQAAAFMRPARDVGGDFYDVFITEDGRALLVVADVSGKGVPASLFMAVSQTLLRATIEAISPIEAAIARANAQLESRNDEGLFVTAFIAELHLASGSLRYINAGHCDGYVRHGDGSLSVLASTGPALAMVAGRGFAAQVVPFGPGDLLFITSDGVTEAIAADGQMFGEERVMAVLAELDHPDPAGALAAVDRAVVAFSQGCEQSDDITCLALART